MSLTINTNIGSMILLNHLGAATQGLNDAIESMTSGYKINHAKDNAANFGIVNNLTTRINSLQVREDNASLGLELVSTVSSSVENITNNLQKIRSLAMSAANGTYGNTSLASLQQELKSRLDEIQRTTDSLSFENKKIFNKNEPTTTKARTQSSGTQTVTSAADKDTTFAQLGINDLSLDLYYANGNKMNSFTLNSGDKIDKLLTILNGSGFSASISNGVIKIDSSAGNYIKGGLADALGITTSTKTLVTNTTSSSNNKITYTTTAFADTTTSFAKAGLNLAGKTLQIKSKTDNSELGTITVDDNSETFQDLFDALANYNISASIKNGKISFSSSDKYITGDIASILGITTSSTNSTTTTGQTTTSSNAIQYTITSNATSSNTLADLGISDSSLVIENNTGTAIKTISVSATTNLGDLFNTLATNSVTASLTDGVISVSGDNVISGGLADALGITKSVVKEGESKTTGVEFTSNGIFYTCTVNITSSQLLAVTSIITTPQKDTLLKQVTYIDASSCEDVLDATAFNDFSTYKITSTEGLQKVSERTNNGEGNYSTFVLMNNINFSSTDSWSPISETISNEFRGNFYGNGYYISGLKYGLFGYSYALIQDVIIKDANITEGESSFIAFVSNEDRGTIKNVSVSGTIKGTYCAGVAYRSRNIDSANVNVEIFSNHGNGITDTSSGTISNCFTTGSIYSEDSSYKAGSALFTDISYAKEISNNSTSMSSKYVIEGLLPDDVIHISQLNVLNNNKYIIKNIESLCLNPTNWNDIASGTTQTKVNVKISPYTPLRSLGISTTQCITMYSNNELKTIEFQSYDDISSITAALTSAGISTSYNYNSISQGYCWSIQSSSTAYIVDVSDDLRNILGLDAGEGKTYNVTKNMEYGNSSSKTLTGKNLTPITNSSKLNDIGITSNKTITVSQNGNCKTVTVKATDTVDNLISKLANVGITATLADGKLTFAGSKNAFIKDMSSELATAFGVSVGNDKTYSETTQTSYTNNQSNNTYKTTGTKALTTSTMLSELQNITFGEIRVRKKNGITGTISVSGTNSIQDFFNKIKNYGITGSITDGKVTLQSNSDCYLETVTGGSNLLTVLDMGSINQTKGTVTEHSPSKALTYEKSLDDWTMYDVDIAIGGISNDADYKIGLKFNFGINYALDITTKAGAEKALSEVDNMLKYLQRSQTDIGSTQNRLLSVLDEISVQYENLVSSRSTLRDADLAKVSSKYLRNQIMQQAATTLLSVANQNPSIALGLI